MFIGTELAYNKVKNVYHLTELGVKIKNMLTHKLGSSTNMRPLVKIVNALRKIIISFFCSAFHPYKYTRPYKRNYEMLALYEHQSIINMKSACE